MHKDHKKLESLVRDTHYTLSELQCTGLPYLKLDQGDHHVDHMQAVYLDLSNILKNASNEGKWKTNNVHFFDIHPIHIDATPIGGILGLHLALTILSKGLMQNSDQLIFDTLSTLNQNKVRTVENKPFYLTSWMTLDRNELNSAANEPYGYIKTAVLLYRARELKQLGLRAQDNALFKTAIIKHNEGLSELEICERYTNEFLEYAFEPGIKPVLYDSARFLFALLLCREFSFKPDTFNEYLSKYPTTKFDFGSDKDTIDYILLAFAIIEKIRISIGEIKEEDLSRIQIAVDLFPNYKIENQRSDTNQNTPETKEIFDEYLKSNDYVINESIGRNLSIAPHRFHNTGIPLSEDEATLLYQDYYKSLILFFYPTGLDKSTFNALKLHYEADSRKLMKQENIASFKSRKVQISFIQDLAFRAFEIQSPISKPNFSNIQDIRNPDLDTKSKNEYNVLNETAKKVYLDTLKHQSIEMIQDEIANVAQNLTHKDSKKFISENITNLPDENIELIIANFYNSNYLSAYMQISNKHDYLLSQIKQDADLFVGNQSVILSVIMELNYFSSLKKNPRTILDLNSF